MWACSPLLQPRIVPPHCYCCTFHHVIALQECWNVLYSIIFSKRYLRSSKGEQYFFFCFCFYGCCIWGCSHLQAVLLCYYCCTFYCIIALCTHSCFSFRRRVYGWSVVPLSRDVWSYTNQHGLTCSISRFGLCQALQLLSQSRAMHY